MSRYIATRAIRGANALVTEAEFMLDKAISEKGGDTAVAFPNTAYFLPLIYGMTGKKVERLSQSSSKPASFCTQCLPRSTGRPIWVKLWTAAWQPL